MRDRFSSAAVERQRGPHPHAVVDLTGLNHPFAVLEALRSPVLPSQLSMFANELQEQNLWISRNEIGRGRDSTLRLQVYATLSSAMTSEPPPSPRPSKGNRLTRPLFFVAGLAFVGLGILGYILPVMPGTIFLILAAGCFARSSSKLEAWIENHPKYGPTVVAWRRHGAIPRKAKYLSIGMMTASFILVSIAHPPALWFWLTGAVLLACALFVATRPEGPKTTG